MASPPESLAMDMASRKRSSNSDANYPSKRPRTSEDPVLGAEESAYPSRRTTQAMPPSVMHQPSNPVVPKNGPAPAASYDHQNLGPQMYPKAPSMNMYPHPPSLDSTTPSRDNRRHPGPPYLPPSTSRPSTSREVGRKANALAFKQTIPQHDESRIPNPASSLPHLPVEDARSNATAMDQRKYWFQQARSDVQGLHVPLTAEEYYIRGISPKVVVPMGQPGLVLLPQMIWDLRSLTPAERFDAYACMMEYSRLSMNEGQYGTNSQVCWQLICELSDRLTRKEREWYMAYTNGGRPMNQEQLARLQHVVQQQSFTVAVTRAEIEHVAKIEDQRAYGTSQPMFSQMNTSQQALSHPTQHPSRLLEGSSADSPIELDSEPSSPCSGSSAADSNGSCLEAPATVAFSTATHDSSCSQTNQDQQSPVVGTKRPREMSEENEEQKAAKKARRDRTENDENQYEHNKDAIEKWWKSGNRNPKARWFEKLYAWNEAKGVVARPGQQPVSQNRKMQAPIRNQNSSAPQVPNNITRTSGMTSPAEIAYIRQGWGNSSPGERKHPKDKVKVPDYPQEDTIENSEVRPDGKYYCKHINGEFDCCQNGLSRDRKKSSIYKDLNNWKKKVERLVETDDLHIAHKTWNRWQDSKIRDKTGAAAQRRNRIDALLQPVQGPQHPVPVPPPQNSVQQSQPQPIQSVNNAVTASSLPTPATQQMNNSVAAPILQVPAASSVVSEVARQNSTVARPTAPTTAQTTVTGLTASTAQANKPFPAEVTQPAQNDSPKQAVVAQDFQPLPPSKKKAVPSAAGSTPNPDFEHRQSAMKAIRSQILMNSAARDRGQEPERVIIAGIDLSKQPISQDLTRVMDKVISALKLEAAELSKASPVPELTVPEFTVPELTVPEEPERLEVTEELGNENPKSLETDVFLFGEAASFWDVVDGMPDIIWEQPCAWSLDDLTNVTGAEDDTNTEPGDPLTLAKEHAQWTVEQQSTVAVGPTSTSFDDFQFAMDTLDAWEAEGHDMFI